MNRNDKRKNGGIRTLIAAVAVTVFLTGCGPQESPVPQEPPIPQEEPITPP